MKGDLKEVVEKGGKQIVRQLNSDRHYTDAHGEALVMHGRSLMLVRNVGHLMTTDAVLDAQGDGIPRGVSGRLCYLVSGHARPSGQW